MENETLELTPRIVYSFLTGKMRGISAGSILDPQRENYRTLTNFWWAFLANFVDEDHVAPYFDISQGRSRSLSTIMNRDIVHTLPHKLKKGLVEGLNPDNFTAVVHWMLGLTRSQFSSQVLMMILNEFEDKFKESDYYYTCHQAFFDSLREESWQLTAYSEDLALMNAIRICWLGLHAVFGMNMNDPDLHALRTNPACSFSTICQGAYSSNLNDKKPQQDIIYQNAEVPIKTCIPHFSSYPDGAIMEEAYSRLASQVPHPVSADENRRKHDGWYIVADWTCGIIALNSSPMPTYRGAKQMASLSNGTLLYVTEIQDYQGLHRSPGQWGYTVYKNVKGYVPMNVLQRLNFL